LVKNSENIGVIHNSCVVDEFKAGAGGIMDEVKTGLEDAVIVNFSVSLMSEGGVKGTSEISLLDIATTSLALSPSE
jgi:hypothetical protein